MTLHLRCSVMAIMQNIILGLRDTAIPMVLVTGGLACMILAIASEIPPADGEPRLLVPRKAIPITGTLLLLIGVPLAIQWPEGPCMLRTLLGYLP